MDNIPRWVLTSFRPFFSTGHCNIQHLAQTCCIARTQQPFSVVEDTPQLQLEWRRFISLIPILAEVFESPVPKLVDVYV